MPFRCRRHFDDCGRGDAVGVFALRVDKVVGDDLCVAVVQFRFQSEIYKRGVIGLKAVRRCFNLYETLRVYGVGVKYGRRFSQKLECKRVLDCSPILVDVGDVKSRCPDYLDASAYNHILDVVGVKRLCLYVLYVVGYDQLLDCTAVFPRRRVVKRAVGYRVHRGCKHVFDYLFSVKADVD